MVYEDFLSKEMREKYNMRALEEFCAIHPEIDYYHTFLIQTDYIPNKLIEAYAIGEEVDASKYQEVLDLRKHCRQKINELSQ